MGYLSKIPTLLCLLLMAAAAQAQITCQAAASVIRHYNPNGIATVNATDLVQNPNSFGTYDFGVLTNGQVANFTNTINFSCGDAGVRDVVVRWTNPNMVVYTCTTSVVLRDSASYCSPAPVQCRNISTVLSPNMAAVVNANQLVANPNPNAAYTIALTGASSPGSSLTFGCSQIGNQNVTITQRVAGIITTCSAIVTVIDSNNVCAPPVQCQSATISLTPNLVATLNASQIVSNYNQAISYSLSANGSTGAYLSFGCNQLGSQTVQVTQTTGAGTSVCNTTVQVTDPNNVCASPIQCRPLSIELTPNLAAVVNASNLVASPQSSGSYAVSFQLNPNSPATSPASSYTFGCSSLGTYSATVTYTNANGAVSSCQTTVTVGDSSQFCQPAALVCQNANIALNSASNTQVSALRFIPNPNPNATYLVGFANMSSLSSSLTLTCNYIGTHQVIVQEQLNGAIRSCQATLVVTDPSGLCNGGFGCRPLTVSINPNQVAVVTASQLVTSPLANGYYTMSVGFPNGGFTSGASNYTFTCGEIGTYTVVVSQRAAGAIQTCTTSVVVNDTNSYCNPNPPCVNPALIDSNVVCPAVYAPVCGCNGVTYSNVCEAENWGGVTSWTNGACPNNGNPTSPLTIRPAIQPSDCAQANCNGSVLLTIVGGTAPYSVIWADGATGNGRQLLCAGSYDALVTDANGDSATISVHVPYLRGCVWPGDADDDATVTFFDILPIALTYGESGFVRPNATINWQGQQCQDWNTVNPIAGLPNYKHIDTDGNGVINQLDMQAVINNYSNFYYRSSSAIGDIPFHINDHTVREGDRVSLPIILGSATEMADNVYGVAFTIEYDAAMVDAGSLSVDVMNSWLGNDLMLAYREESAQGKINVVIARKDRMNVSNFGEIGKLNLTIRDDILRFPTRSMQVRITNVKLIDNQNTALGTTRPEGVITVDLESSLDRSGSVALNVFPNPAQNLLNVQAANAQIEELRLVSVTGQLLMSVQNINQNSLQLPVNELANGVYMLHVITDKGLSVQRVQIQR